MSFGMPFTSVRTAEGYPNRLIRIIVGYATGGNVEQTVGVQLGRDNTSTLALGFGTTQAAAVATARATASTSVARMTASYLAGWARYDAGLKFPVLTTPGLTLSQRASAIKNYYQAANVVKESEDKTYAATVADDGNISNLRIFVEQGGESVAVDDKGNVYITAGQVFVYDPSGHLIDTIDVPERPSQLLFGASDRRTLFIRARSSLYAVQTRYQGRR